MLYNICACSYMYLYRFKTWKFKIKLKNVLNSQNETSIYFKFYNQKSQTTEIFDCESWKIRLILWILIKFWDLFKSSDFCTKYLWWWMVFAEQILGHFRLFSSSQICYTPRAGFEPVQRLSSDFVEWSFAWLFLSSSSLLVPQTNLNVFIFIYFVFFTLCFPSCMY